MKTKLTETPITLRVHPKLLDEVDQIAERLADDPDACTLAGGASRSHVLRVAIVEGLRVLRRKLK